VSHALCDLNLLARLLQPALAHHPLDSPNALLHQLPSRHASAGAPCQRALDGRACPLRTLSDSRKCSSAEERARCCPPPRHPLHHVTHLPKRLVAVNVSVDARVAKHLPLRLSANVEQLLAGHLGVSSQHVHLTLLQPLLFHALAVQPTLLVQRNTVLALVRHREAQRGRTKSCTLSTHARCVLFFDLYSSLICVLFRQNGDFMRFVVHPREICSFMLIC